MFSSFPFKKNFVFLRFLNGINQHLYKIALFVPLSHRAFETQMTRLEAEFVQREAPPSYGQLIAQGLIPPVDDFPVYNPTQVCEYDTEFELR